MAAVRPVLTVFKLDGSKPEQVKTPAVFAAPIRADIVQQVHTNMSKNRRQAYAVKHRAGMGYSAESWGTGRAVARIPRVSGGGTGRSGQGAFGNMCRGGRLFAPTKTWRRWHRHTNVQTKRYAVASALAASAVPALVMARGHAIGNVNEVPLVVDDSIQSLTKTKAALAALKKVGAFSDVARCAASRKPRTGSARSRGRAHAVKRGPLIVIAEDNGASKAFRNIPGVEIANVNALNLLQLAPGASLGRFIVWSKSAVAALHNVFGSVNRLATGKKGFHVPAPTMTNADLDRLISSNEIQSHLKAPGRRHFVPRPVKLNPLTNFAARVALNPYAKTLRIAELVRQANAKKQKAAALEAARAGKPVQLTPKQIRIRAARKALRAQHKANFARISTGVDNASNPGFNVAVYKQALAHKVAGPAPKAVVVAVGPSEREKKAAFGAVALKKKTLARRKAVAKHVKAVRSKPAPKAAAAGKKK